MLAGCSSISDMTSYIPFMGKDKKVIDLDKDKIDQKSYAAAYEATVATYKDRVTKISLWIILQVVRMTGIRSYCCTNQANSR